MQNIMRLGALATACLLTAELSANVTGSDLQNFNPSYTPVDNATVHSARTMGSGRLGLGLFSTTP